MQMTAEERIAEEEENERLDNLFNEKFRAGLAETFTGYGPWENVRDALYYYFENISSSIGAELIEIDRKQIAIALAEMGFPNIATLNASWQYTTTWGDQAAINHLFDKCETLCARAEKNYD